MEPPTDDWQTAKIIGLCNTSTINNHENEKNALKENEEQSNTLYKFDNVWRINLRSNVEVLLRLYVLASLRNLPHWYPQPPHPTTLAQHSLYFFLLKMFC